MNQTAFQPRPSAKKKLQQACVLALALSMALPAWSRGNFTLVEGDVRVGNATAALNANVETGNTITAGNSSRAVMRMADGQVIAVSPNSRFTLEDFKYQSDAPAQGTTFLRLLAGSMRVVTGLIGKAQPKNFRVVTSTATIGIRGTDFLLGINADGSAFVQVLEGGVDVTSAAASQSATAGSVISVAPSGAIAVSSATGLTALTAAQFQTLLTLNPALVAPIAGAAGAATGTAAAGSAAAGAGTAAVTTAVNAFVAVMGAAAAVGAAASSTTHH